MDLYSIIHRQLVAHTRAYRRLYKELGERACGLERVERAALVPSSTGELLEWIAPAARRWTAVDYNPECLAHCAERSPGIETLQADLGASWPLPADTFGLISTVHSLHFLPDPAAVARGVFHSLRPGGVWLVVNYARREAVARALWRVRAEYGLQEALNFAPWKILDEVMMATGGSSGPRDAEATVALVREAGLRVESTTSTFAGFSALVVARKPC